MKREEAIQVLQAALTAPFIYGEYANAIGMAIEALSAKPSGDIISRQDAVNTIKRYKHRLEGRGQTYGFLLEEFEHRIPSAQADGDLISRADVIDAIDAAIDANSPQWAILRTKIGFLPSAEAHNKDAISRDAWFEEGDSE